MIRKAGRQDIWELFPAFLLSLFTLARVCSDRHERLRYLFSSRSSTHGDSHMSRLPAVLVVLCFAVRSFAETPARTHDVTVDDYFTLAAVTEVAVSRDGSCIAYTDSRWQKSTNDRKSDLWIL